MFGNAKPKGLNWKKAVLEALTYCKYPNINISETKVDENDLNEWALKDFSSGDSLNESSEGKLMENSN